MAAFERARQILLLREAFRKIAALGSIEIYSFGQLAMLDALMHRDVRSPYARTTLFWFFSLVIVERQWKGSTLGDHLSERRKSIFKKKGRSIVKVFRGDSTQKQAVSLKKSRKNILSE